MKDVPLSYEALRIEQCQKEFREVGALIESVIDNNAEQFGIGPDYLARLRTGQDIDIASYAIRYDTPRELNIGMSDTAFVLVAHETSGRVLGVRSSHLFPPDGRYSLQAFGTIVTSERGVGVGSALEIAHQDLLIREATRREEPVIYVAVDKNQGRINAFQHAYNIYGDPVHAEFLDKITAERSRWESMYGHDRRYGFKTHLNGNLTRIIDPSPATHSEDPTTLQAVRIERGEDGTSKTVVKERVDDVVQRRTEKFDQLHFAILPGLKAVQ